MLYIFWKIIYLRIYYLLIFLLTNKILRLIKPLYLVGDPSNLFIIVQTLNKKIEILSLKEKRRIQNSLTG